MTRADILKAMQARWPDLVEVAEILPYRLHLSPRYRRVCARNADNTLRVLVIEHGLAEVHITVNGDTYETGTCASRDGVHALDVALDLALRGQQTIAEVAKLRQRGYDLIVDICEQEYQRNNP